VSMMIAAGMNLKQISAYIGHRSVATTLDIYGHLMEGDERRAAAAMDAYLEDADT
jgi:integrase